MAKRLIYLPLERYKERYTEWSSGVAGAMESDLNDLNIPYISIRPDNNVRTIKDGVVLDVQQRAKWGFEQTERLIKFIMDGLLTSQDAVYIEDFWHPGMEMIPYALSSKFGIDTRKWPKLYAFCYAQSVDKHDFTHPWRYWMRSFENAWGNLLTGVFVSCPEHLNLLDVGTNIPWDCIHAVGLPFNSTVVESYATPCYLRDKDVSSKYHRVIWSSRWDKEKNPQFFCSLLKEVVKDRPDLVFTVCTGSETLRSNDPGLLKLARVMSEKYPHNFQVLTGLDKSRYYDVLCTSLVQFNAADQDWVSNTLLEATTFGCMPLYPNYLSFPAALNFDKQFMYEKGNLKDAKKQLYNLLDLVNPDNNLGDRMPDVSFVYKKYNHTFRRALKIMGFNVGKTLPLVFQEEQ